MKILFCTNAFENTTNGPAKFANLILRINELFPDVEIRVLTEDVSKDSEKVYKLHLNIKNWYKLFGQFYRMWVYHKAAEAIYKEFPFDLLVYNNALVGLYSAYVKKFKTIGMINDYSNLDSDISYLFGNRYKAKRYIFRFIEKLAVRQLPLIISNSNYLTEKIISAYGVKREKVVRLYKAINLEKIVLKTNTGIDTSNIKLLFIKTDFETGGLYVLAKALARLPQFSFQLTLVGPGLNYQNKIYKLFSDIPNVTLVYKGPLNQSQVREIYQHNDIFCVPSIKEAFGVANIEALASGLPVVSSDAGGIPEVLQMGACGWLAIAGDSESLAECLKEAIENKNLREQKVKRGLSVVSKFSSEYMFAEFITICKKVIGKDR